MKNIKVNIINYEGVRSSTTLNYAICEEYYLKISKDTDKPQFGYGVERQKAVSLAAQAYVNDLMDELIDADTLGVGQYALESTMLNYLIYK